MSLEASFSFKKLSLKGKENQTDGNHIAKLNICLTLVQRTINFSCCFGVCLNGPGSKFRRPTRFLLSEEA